MTTLFDASLTLAETLGDVVESTSTGTGTSATVVDTTRTEADGYWNEGTIWLITGTYANSSRRITSSVSSGTITFSPTLAGNSGSGITYRVVTGAWPRAKLWRFINDALLEIGDVPNLDTSLTTVAYQESYTLPAGVQEVARVEVASSLSSPYEYQPQYGNWEERGGYIYFRTGREPQTTGYKIRLVYHDPHDVMDADNDTINAYVHMDRLKWTAAVYAWRWRIQMTMEDEPIYQQFFNEAVAKTMQMKIRHPIRFPVTAARNSL